MNQIKTKTILMNCVLLSIFSIKGNAQDTIQQTKTDSIQLDSIPKQTFNPEDKVYHFNAKKLIIPATLITYGSLSLAIPALDNLNKSTQNEILEDKTKGNKFDNYTQYLPAAAVYGLNLAGVQGKHNLRDRTIIFATSQIINTGLVMGLKHTVQEERPDGTNNLSFPSGHTANAFSTAQFLVEFSWISFGCFYGCLSCYQQSSLGWRCCCWSGNRNFIDGIGVLVISYD